MGAWSIPTFDLQVRKNPEKTLPRKLVLTGDQTWAPCMTGAHATTWPTVVDDKTSKLGLEANEVKTIFMVVSRKKPLTNEKINVRT